MLRVARIVRKLLTPVTIMLIPHTSRRSLTFSVPTILVAVLIAFSLVGMGFVGLLARDAVLYKSTKEKLDYYDSEISDLHSTLSALKLAESEFRRIFSKGTKEGVLDDLDATDSGSLDMEALKAQIAKTVESVGEIRDYLSQTRELYRATPMGSPISGGHITSFFGRRTHPINGEPEFHTGIDISTAPGTPVYATADGVISFAGMSSGGNGNLVAIEHGFGYETYFAHNRQIAVKVGQVVKRGDLISYVGSTGSSTGPHVHYEIWKDGRSTDPSKFLGVRRS